jgi:methyl-accepting chemotaxis protein
MQTSTVERERDLDLGEMFDALQRLRDGDFSVRLPSDLKNRAGSVARVFNSLAQMLEEYSAETIRITDEVGKHGMLGGQAEVFGIYGRWREMLDSLNRMGVGLTVELRRTSQAAEAIAKGDTSKRLTPELIGGEVAQMQQHLNAIAERIAQP